MRGRDQLSLYTEEGMAKAQEWFRRAVEFDGGLARAYSGIAATYLIPWHQRWNLKPEETLDPAYEFATRAIALDDTLPLARMILSQVLLWRKQHDDAVIEARRAIDLDPNDPDGYFNLGLVLGWSGEPDEAIGLILRAQRGNPHYPPVYLWALGRAYFQARHYEDAAVALRRSAERFRDFMPNHLFAAAAYAHLGLRDEAGSAVAEVQRINPRRDQRIRDGWLPSLPKWRRFGSRDGRRAQGRSRRLAGRGPGRMESVPQAAAYSAALAFLVLLHLLGHQLLL